LRASTPSLRKYDVFLKASGHVPKSAGKFTERTVTCISGTRIVPFDISHRLSVRGTIITDIGTEGRDCFDRTNTISEIDIDYQPPQVEIIEISTGGLSAADKAQLNAIQTAAEFSADINGGSWKIIGSEMVFYKPDNITEIARFPLKDINGNPISPTNGVISRTRA